MPSGEAAAPVPSTVSDPPTTTTVVMAGGTAGFAMRRTIPTPFSTYYTHKNGGRPFQVEVPYSNDRLRIYKREENDTYPTLTHEFECEQVFVGKSPRNPMTEFSGGHGPKFDGNTLLGKIAHVEGKVDLAANPRYAHTYVYVGETIRRFRTYGAIVEYVSCVGNSDVPYPWARDELGYIYLPTFDTVLKPRPEIAADALAAQELDYIDYYIRAALLTVDRGCPHRIPRFPHFRDILSYQVGNQRFTMTYDVNPAEKFDRLVERVQEDNVGSTEPILTKVYKTNGEEQVLTKEEYVELMQAYGTHAGLEPMEFIQNLP